MSAPGPRSPRRRVLVVTSRLPYPPVGGDKVRSDFFVQRLSRHYDVHLLSLADAPPDAGVEAYLRRYCADYRVVPVPRWRHLLAALRGLLGGEPLQVGYYRLGSFARYVESLAPTVDFAVAINQRTAAYLLGFPKPSFLEMTDSQAMICRTGARGARSWAWRKIYAIEARRIEAFERACVANFRSTFFVNRDEAAFYSRPDRTLWLPNGAREDLLRRERPRPHERAYCFLGRLDYQPNVDAITCFAEYVLPRLPADLPWYIIGPSAGPRIAAIAARHANVHLTGFLDDPWEVVARCACMVAPMQTGGGVQNKILEAMALGVPVVTTRHGAAPIVGGQNGIHFRVEDTPGSMAAAVSELVSDVEQAATIGAAGRELIRSRYTWDHAERTLLGAIESGLEAEAVPS